MRESSICKNIVISQEAEGNLTP